MMLAISDIGSSALQALRQCPAHGLPGSVIAGFSRCSYISLAVPDPSNRRLSPACVCVGQAGIQRGPVNLLFDNDTSWRQFRRHASPGATVSLHPDRLVHAAVVCDLSAARVSNDGLPNVPAGIAEHPASARLVSRRLLQLCENAPADSLAFILFGTHTRAESAHDALQQAFIDYIYPVCQSLSDVLRQNLLSSGTDKNLFAENSASVAQTILGAGRGLTPAGDDLLAGVLLGLWHRNLGAHARQLMQLLQPDLATHTNCVSATLLQEAAQGRAGQSVISVFERLQCEAEFRPALIRKALASQGHSSGWDCLAGIALLHFAMLTP